MRELWKVRPAQIPPLGEKEGRGEGIASRAGTGVSGLLKIKERIAVRVLSSYGVSRRDSQKAGVVEVIRFPCVDTRTHPRATLTHPQVTSTQLLLSHPLAPSQPNLSTRLPQSSCCHPSPDSRKALHALRKARNGLQSPDLVTCVIALGYTLSTWHQVEALAAKVESQCVDIADFKTYMTTNWKVGGNQKDAIGCIIRDLIVDPTCHSYMELWATQAQPLLGLHQGGWPNQRSTHVHCGKHTPSIEFSRKSIAFVLTFGAHFVAGYINNLFKADAELYGVAGSYLLKIVGRHLYDTSPLFADPAAAAKTVPASFSAVPSCLDDL
ncbi:hypothetical protein BOTBODRAFT_640476 [Botryobasidium botryosum FD-172 SS1]|uniref:Uncharacterized protein n=1 Tax=Botryobasidium botryosum (strain FD-172 SS1) TaxID=930990 RepID=A0A067MED5_BOTB1|nr:hypothetical protein BOTBODRAFT_640476 [Botryobasidium botryosum FD-172 SS1]